MSVYSSVEYHRTMNFDGVRNPAYERAIRDAVTSKSVVLDLGAGLGMLGFVAARAGARMVYLVEPEPVIEVTRKVAEANGLDNVECIQATELARRDGRRAPCPDRYRDGSGVAGPGSRPGEAAGRLHRRKRGW